MQLKLISTCVTLFTNATKCCNALIKTKPDNNPAYIKKVEICVMQTTFCFTNVTSLDFLVHGHTLHVERLINDSCGKMYAI